MSDTFSTVETASGRLRGRVSAGVHRFLGVPYGASTAGENRFRAPQPVAPWSGVRDALQYGATCPQFEIRDAPLFAWYHAPLHNDEDCLSLNVFTPGIRDDARRPVLVWFHGGGFNNGAGSAEVFEGSRLARYGDAVVVTLTHRLNVLGFLHLGDHGEDAGDACNAGLLDMVAALRWVRDNIAEFGGDPARVTLFGQSGGTGKISALMAMPVAKGLFHGAILQSGCALTLRTPDQAARHARSVLSHLPGDGKSLHRLRQLPVDQLLAAARRGGPRFGAVVDGRWLPRHPCEPDAPEVSADVPVIIGSTAQEATYFYKKDSDVLGIQDMAEVRARLAHRLQRDAATVDALLDACRLRHPESSPAALMIRIETDYLYRLKCIQYAERKAALGRAPAYMYQLAWQTPAEGGRFGAPHTMCVPLVFRRPELAAGLLGESAELHALSDSVCTAWLAFARSGDPNAAGLPHWPPYQVPERATLVFDSACARVNDPDAQDRLAIAALGPHHNYISSVREKFVRPGA